MIDASAVTPVSVLRAIEEWITGLVKAMVSEAIDVVLKNRAVLTESTVEAQLKAMDKRGELCWVGTRIREEVEAEIENQEQQLEEQAIKEIVEGELDNSDFVDERRVDTMIEDALSDFECEHLEDSLVERIEKIVALRMDDEVTTLVRNVVDRFIDKELPGLITEILVLKLDELLDAKMTRAVEQLVTRELAAVDWEAIWLRHLQPSFVNALEDLNWGSVWNAKIKRHFVNSIVMGLEP